MFSSSATFKPCCFSCGKFESSFTCLHLQRTAGRFQNTHVPPSTCCVHTLMQELLDFLEAEIDAKGLDAIMPGAFMAKYARPRRFEVRCGLLPPTSFWEKGEAPYICPFFAAMMSKRDVGLWSQIIVAACMKGRRCLRALETESNQLWPRYMAAAGRSSAVTGCSGSHTGRSQEIVDLELVGISPKLSVSRCRANKLLLVVRADN